MSFFTTGRHTLPYLAYIFIRPCKQKYKIPMPIRPKGGAHGRRVAERHRGPRVQGDRRAHAQARVVQGEVLYTTYKLMDW